MTVQDAIKTIKHAPLEDRLKVIEILLQSLRSDFVQNANSRSQQKPFVVRTFNLGEDATVNRDEMYVSRGL